MSDKRKDRLPGWSYIDDTDLGADAAILSPESQDVVRQGKTLYQQGVETGDQALQDQGHSMAEGERAKYGYSGGANGGGYVPLFSTQEEPDYGEAPTEYKAAMDRAIQALQSRSKFTYDPEEDPSYQEYKEQYTRLGKQAMEDSYGHAALRTGGLGGSAAMSASQQAYNSYMSALADKIPELRQIAYQMYQDEEDRLRQDIDLFGGLDQQAWNRWNTDRSFQRGAFETDRQFDYGKAADQWDMVRQLMRDQRTDEETAYQREQDARQWAWDEDERDYTRQEAQRSREEDAAKGLAELLASGGDYSGYAGIYDKLTPEQIATLEEIYQGDKDYESKLRELDIATRQASLDATKRSGSSGERWYSSDDDGGDETGLSGTTAVFEAMRDSGNPGAYLRLNYKQLGVPYNQINNFLADYQTWEAAQPKTPAADVSAPNNSALSAGAQRILNSLSSMQGQRGSETAIANTIAIYTDQGKLTDAEARYLFQRFGYDPDEWLE